MSDWRKHVEAMMRGEDFKVEQTYQQLGQLIFDEVVDQLTHQQDPHIPVESHEVEHAEGVAARVRDGVLSQLDAWYP